MIIGRQGQPTNIAEALAVRQNFFLRRERENIAYVSMSKGRLSFGPCDDGGLPITEDIARYDLQTGRVAVIEFVKLLPFPVTVKFDLIKGS